MEGFAANPDKKHYWNRDIYAYVTSWIDAGAKDTTAFRPFSLKVGDTAFLLKWHYYIE